MFVQFLYFYFLASFYFYFTGFYCFCLFGTSKALLNICIENALNKFDYDYVRLYNGFSFFFVSSFQATPLLHQRRIAKVTPSKRGKCSVAQPMYKRFCLSLET